MEYGPNWKLQVYMSLQLVTRCHIRHSNFVIILHCSIIINVQDIVESEFHFLCFAQLLNI